MNRIVALGIITFLLVTSCTVYREFPIEVYKPGEIAIPPNAENIALISRNFKYEGDTLQHYYKRDHQLLQSLTDPDDIDSLLVNTCLSEFSSNLKENTGIKQIETYSGLFKLHYGNKMPALSNEMVDQLTSATQANLIISLETFTSFYSEFTSSNYEAPAREVVTAAVWAVYDPYTDKIINRKSMIDTVFWNSYDNEGRFQRDTKLPPRLTALDIAARLAGENYAKHFYASWETVNRMYSVPPLAEFKIAENYIRQNKWDEAIEIWKPYTKASNGKIAIHACYNTALAYEMKDEINSAQVWLNEALSLAKKYRAKDETRMVELYIKVLSQRQKEVQQLDSEI